MQALLSLMLVGFSMYKLSNDDRPGVDKTPYLILLTSVIAYWLPSPTQHQDGSRPEISIDKIQTSQATITSEEPRRSQRYQHQPRDREYREPDISSLEALLRGEPASNDDEWLRPGD